MDIKSGGCCIICQDLLLCVKTCVVICECKIQGYREYKQRGGTDHRVLDGREAIKDTETDVHIHEGK